MFAPIGLLTLAPLIIGELPVCGCSQCSETAQGLDERLKSSCAVNTGNALVRKICSQLTNGGFNKPAELTRLKLAMILDARRFGVKMPVYNCLKTRQVDILSLHE